jgi:DNA-binding transcriptional ArsR family regulator
MSPVAREFIPATAAPLFAALGDSTRLALLGRMRDGRTHTLVQLTEGTGLSRQGVSKHLRVLAEAGMVNCRRHGRESHYSFRPAGLAQAQRALQRAAQQWDAQAERLQAFLAQR